MLLIVDITVTGTSTSTKTDPVYCVGIYIGKTAKNAQKQKPVCIIFTITWKQKGLKNNSTHFCVCATVPISFSQKTEGIALQQFNDFVCVLFFSATIRHPPSAICHSCTCTLHLAPCCKKVRFQYFRL